MKIIFGSDHRGYEKKNELISHFKGLNYEVEDKGAFSSESVDYPVFAKSVCESVLESDALGVLICGTGIGMSIAANKIKGIRCAKADNKEDAKYSRAHNNANVIALSNNKDIEELKELIEVFVTTPFSNEERHIRRISEFENF